MQDMTPIQNTGNIDILVVPSPVAEAAPVDPLPIGDDGEITVIARYPYQMESCRVALVEWCERKIASVKAEADDLQENVEIARKNKWGMAALQRAAKKATDRVEYYLKLKAALDAGYCIVPNFPVQMFAIRTGRKTPDRGTTSRWSETHEQKAQALPVGEGEYKNPAPVVMQNEYQVKNAKGELVTEKQYWASMFRDELDFPFATAKPEILTATARALADKIFDEIGVLPGKNKKEDPIIVGRIRDPRSVPGYPKFTTFLIAWFIDTRDL